MIMGREEKVPEDFSRDFFRPFRLLKDLADREKVPERLGHLLFIDLDKSIVDPIACEFFSRCAA